MTVALRLLKLGRGRAGLLSLGVLLSFLTAACGAALLVSSAYLISAAALRPPVLALLVAIVAVRAFALGRAVLRYLERLVSHDAALGLLADVRCWFYDRLEPLAPAGLAGYRTGDVLARLVGDIEGLRDYFIRGLGPPLTSAAMLALAAAFAGLLLAPAGAVLALGMALGGAAVPLLVRHLARSIGPPLTRARAELGAELVELLEGAPDLVAFGCEGARQERLLRVDRRLRRLSGASAAVVGLGNGLLVVLAGLSVAGILLVAITAVRSGAMDGIVIGALALLPLAAFEAIQPLSSAFDHLDGQLEAGRRLFAVVDQDPAVRVPVHPLPPPAPGVLALEDAWLSYGRGAAPALCGVDLCLAPGRRVALVGPSGAGKTTITSVLVRFRDLDAGRATLDGQDLRDYRPDEVRRVIGLVTQQVHIFNTSVLENIRLARPSASLADIEAAARRARLLEWVSSLSRGWDTPVGERGAQVSGGQRQRIALARAFLADFPILLLDEPAAQLDPVTARELMSDILANSGAGGLLVITHRLIEMERMDEIVVLGRGRVVERGTHEQLLAACGLYRLMARDHSGKS